MNRRNAISGAVLLSFCMTCGAWAQQDPGPRRSGWSRGAYSTLNSNELLFFTQAMARFKLWIQCRARLNPDQDWDLDTTGTVVQCAIRSLPLAEAVRDLQSPQNPMANPQVAAATLDAATNTVPPFITASGPVREDGSFTTATERSTAGCMISTRLLDAAMRPDANWHSHLLRNS